MPETLFRSLLNTLDQHSAGSVAGALGQPEQSVSRGLETSLTSLLAVFATKAGDSGALRRIMDLAPGGSDVTWSQLAGEASNPNSTLLSGGKRTVSGIFGTSEGGVISWISRECGLQSGAASTILAMAAPMMMGFLRKRMRSDGMDIAGLGRTLQQEAPAIRKALPVGLGEVLSAPTATATPVIAQAVQHEKSSSRWLPAAIAVCAALFGLFWLLHHARKPTVAQFTPPPAIPSQVTPVAPMTGTANREMTGTANREMTGTVNPNLNNVDLRFQTGSAALRPDSEKRLHEVASMLAANPDVHMKISGYTDDVGNAEQNLRLSDARANRVMAELVREGVSPGRLTAQGYGEQNPIADNSTSQGRAQNRRVTISQP
jgi:OmpA-OmpF porin, OOP family